MALIAFGVCILTALGAIYFMHIQWLGFPDSHLTELGRAERAAFPFVATPVGLLALVATVLGVRPSAPPGLNGAKRRLRPGASDFARPTERPVREWRIS